MHHLIKYFLVLISLFLLQACYQKKEKTSSGNKNKTGKIEVYDFDQLRPLLDAKDDKVYVVNFWATWCKPCINELPYFENLKKTNGEKIKVILVSLDFHDKLESQLSPFVLEKGIKSQVILLDDPYENEWIPKVDESWTKLIEVAAKHEAVVLTFNEGSFTEESLNKELLKFIKT